MSISKPNLTRVWADQAAGGDVVDPGDPKFDAGWLAEIPTYQNFNFLQQLFTQGLAYLNQQGVGVWDTNTTYPAVFGLAKGSTNGFIYQSVVEQAGNNPETDDGTNWILWSTDYSAMKSGRKNLLDNPEFAVWVNGETFSITTLIPITADRWRVRGTASGGTTDVSLQTSNANGRFFQAVIAGHTDVWYILQRLELFETGVAPYSQQTFTLTVDTNNTASANWELIIGIGGVAEVPAPPLDDEGEQILLEAVATQTIPSGNQTTSFTFTVPDLSSYTISQDSYLSVFLQSEFALPDGTYQFLRIQLERGTQFTTFEDYIPSLDQARCARMRQAIPVGTGNRYLATGFERQDNQMEFVINLSEKIRKTPTVNFSDFIITARGNNDSLPLSAFNFSGQSTIGVRVRATVGNGADQDYAYIITIDLDSGSTILLLNADL